jgi:hypothetical protein
LGLGLVSVFPSCFSQKFNYEKKKEIKLNLANVLLESAGNCVAGYRRPGLG